MERIKIGWAKRDVSVDCPIAIPGQMYIRASEGVMDPIYVTVLVMDSGEDSVIFCSCDVVVLRGGVIKMTREKVASLDPTVPVDKIIMNATHTHSGPNINNGNSVTPDGLKLMSGEEYREIFTKGAAEAIVEAWRNRAPGGFAYGYGYAVVAHSRRVVYFDDRGLATKNAIAPNGHGVMYGKTDLDTFSHYEAGADHFLNAVFTFDEKDALTGMIVNVPCPSQLSEHFTRLSADYWCEVRQGVAKEFGEGIYVLPQCAAAGDLSPRILHYKQAQARRMKLKYDLPYDAENTKKGSVGAFNKVMGERRDIAERILEGLKDVYSWAKKEIFREVPVRHVTETMDLERRFITDEEKAWCEKNIEEMKDQIPEGGTPEEIRVATSRYNSVKGRNTRAIARWEDQKIHPTLPMRMHVVQVGDIAFSTCRFEFYMDFMHRIQGRSPFIQTLMIQLAGDEGGNYLATERGKANKGYSASLFDNMVSPAGGQQIVEETLRVLNEFKARDAE